jgi:hypothetical protein
MNYKIFLSDLFTSLPEVNGAFLFTSQSGILAKQLNVSMNNFDTLEIGEKMTAIAEMASEVIHDITKIEVNFGDMILSCRVLPDQNLLFLMHKPELSEGMIRMALQMAINNSNQEDDQEDESSMSSYENMEDEGPPVTHKEIKQEDIDALMAPESPLAKPLNTLQDAFANFIGPVAVLVFQDLLLTWCQENTPSLETLKNLIPLIDNEIEDPKDIIAFHNTIKDLIPQE